MPVRLLRLIFTVLFFTYIYNTSTAQNIIKGVVKDNNGNAINQAQVTIYGVSNRKAILGYTFTDSKGNFTLKTNLNPDSLALKVRSMGYREQEIFPVTTNGVLEVKLMENPIAIEEVVVKSNPIRVKGDTVTYLVSSFARAKDISIGDVIKNMPGFYVNDDGAIYYEGKPIQKYYIEGSDLLENNYTIANKNLPHKSVAAVDVLKNHQPVKILNGFVPTDNVSLNIRLKNDITVTGNSKLGAGYQPVLYDINITPMLFQKRRQLLSTFQANNIGQELETQFFIFKVQYLDMLEAMIFGKPQLVSVQTVPPPSIKMNRWLDNKSMLLSSKTLFKLESDFDVKLDASYYSDRNYRFGATERRYLINEYGIMFAESTSNKFQKNALRINTDLTKNTPNLYLKSSINLANEWETNDASLLLNNNLSNSQRASIPYFNLSNENQVILKKNNRLSTFSTYFTATRSNQSLSIHPGVFSDVLNNGQPFNELMQQIAYEKYLFYTNLSRIYSVKPFTFSLDPKITIESGKLFTSMQADNNSLDADSLKSHKQWLCYKPGISANVTYEKGNLEASVSSPIYLRLLNEKDIDYAVRGFERTYIIEPGLNVKYRLTNDWKITGRYSYGKSLGRPEDKLNGYLIKSIYLLSRENYDIGEKVSNRFFGSIEYANILKGVNFSTSFNNVYSTNSYIVERNLLNTNIITYQSLPYKNNSTALKLNSNLSWMLMSYSSSLAIKYDFYSLHKFELFNRELKKVRNQTSTVTFNFNTTALKDFELDYKFRFSLLSYSSYKNKFSYNTYSHLFSVSYFASSKNFFCIETELYRFDKNGTAKFLNLMYNVKLQNGRYVLTFTCNNLLNSKTFDTYNVTSSMVEHSMISLRPQSFIVSLTMPLIPVNR